MSSNDLNGFHIQAKDGEIGHVDDVLVDEDDWNIRYVVLDTSNWIGGRSVVVSPRVLKGVDQPDRIVHVDVARDDVRRSPELDSIEVGPGEDAPPFAII
jgi:PRC-barrel domain protein